MDEGRFSVSASELHSRLGTAAAPLVIDVRRSPAFDADKWMIAGATRRSPDAAAQWAPELPDAGPVVVYCVHGHEVSQGAAATLRGIGLDARFLEGGIAEWA